MESLDESNCRSMSDSFSLYERYLRSFNVVDNLNEEVNPREPTSTNCDYESSNSGSNIDLSDAPSTVTDKNKLCDRPEHPLINSTTCHSLGLNKSYLQSDLCLKAESSSSLAVSLLDNSSATADNCLLNEKSDPVDVPVSSDDSKPEIFKQPMFITSTMENSNNAVDSVPMFRDVRSAENVFKLPISELSFNGTIKHVKKLKPIVDPITALTSNNGLVNMDDKSTDYQAYLARVEDIEPVSETGCNVVSSDDHSSSDMRAEIEKTNESTGDSQYEECKKEVQREEGSNTKWNSEQSHSSLEESFDSGVRSPDLFSDEDEEVSHPQPEAEPFWNFLKDFEVYEKKKVKKIEQTLQGVLPPPSITTLKIDVTEMLKKYYCFLPAFSEDVKVDASKVNSATPTKRVSFVQIPTETESTLDSDKMTIRMKSTDSVKSASDLDTSASDKSVNIKMGSEIEALDTAWPEILKCRYYDVYYNVTTYSEKFELLARRYSERFVGAETDTSVCIYSGGLQSPSSACKRKALRLKMAQAKSPGRRLSHLARRRQAFCTAATIERQASTKMVLIDKKKLINTSERKSPRLRRTPGKKTPGKKTPAKTPKTRSGGSSKKKAMRRLLMDQDTLTRSQPTRETLKRALFISPENRKSVPVASSSVPLQAMRSKRALFGSPELAQTKSSDGSSSDQFLKRKRDALDDVPETSRSKIAKSLSFGGDNIGNSSHMTINRRASEMFMSKNTTQLNENHKKKLLWAVTEALRAHGWSMSSPGFREKASALARLTKKLLTLPPHAARLASPHLSTSETMLKLARRYVFAIIQERSVDDCFKEEQTKLSNETNTKVTGYISATAYQQMKARQAASTSQIKENYNTVAVKPEQPRSNSKNILQDKLVNIDSDSNSNNSDMSMIDKANLGIFKSNSMPSFEEAAKMRARRQISFDNVEFPKR
ncbi:uncharacterized protein LOC106132664 isoform X2 [Amyelois transitella]|uniref:uncharacterized protein LOC106132664 isoform X2 n=1 Tax=Amyelois transitella TaxID=680683 RepID=UPI0029904833|nr:uncharacterized protein LOC106132664 isoform X2 [Amyelois transitella]